MKKKNLLEILKDSQLGTELYSKTLGTVILTGINSTNIEIMKKGKTFMVNPFGKLILSLEGGMKTITNEVDLFLKSSDEKFNEGDILVIKSTGDIFIYKSIDSDGINYKLCLDRENNSITTGLSLGVWPEDVREATIEERDHLITILAKQFNWEQLNQTQNNDETIIEEEINYPLIQLKRFDQVLVRNTDEQSWVKDIFDSKDSDSGLYTCLNGNWKQCIPFIKETGIFLNNNSNPPKNYITW